MKIALVPNPAKPDALAAAGDLYKLLTAQGIQTATLSSPNHQDLQIFAPNLLVVLGGDGSILAVAHAMVGIDAPIVGINFGKLGYMAAFSLEQFRRNLQAILAGDVPVTRRTVLQGGIYPLPHPTADVQPVSQFLHATPRFSYTALNEIAINAGEPFRMIELEAQIDDQETPPFRSDGVIVATATGSTGYNLSAGGPLIAPDVPAMVLTPICPHSLSFRPVVVPDTTTIIIRPIRVNPGTAVNFDGQVAQKISEQECLLVRRAPSVLKLVENPEMSHWGMLAHKLHWAQSPRG